MFDFNGCKTHCESQFETEVKLKKELNEIEAFKHFIIKLVTDYIKTIDDKTKTQDLKIHQAQKYFNDNLNQAVVDVISTTSIEQVYNNDSEEMTLILKIGGVE